MGQYILRLSLQTNARKGLVLLRHDTSIQLLVEFGCHLYREEQKVKIKKINKKERRWTSFVLKWLTFLFSVYGMKDVVRRRRTQAVTRQDSKVNQLVKIVNGAYVLNSFPNAPFKLAFKFGMLHNCKTRENMHKVRMDDQSKQRN